MRVASLREIEFIKARLTGEKPNLDENRKVTVDLRLCRRQLELRVVLTPVWQCAGRIVGCRRAGKRIPGKDCGVGYPPTGRTGT
jgi:hypothetical protein